MKKINVLALLVIIMSQTACSKKEKVIIYTAAEEDRINYIHKDLNKKFPDYNIVIQSLGTGNLVSKLKGEGKNTDCDIFYDLEVTNAETILASNSNLFADLSEYDYSIYNESALGFTSTHKKYAINGKTYAALLVNKSVLESKGLEIPSSYADLLKSGYKNLIAMPNPKSSGTGYSLYNGIVTLYGESGGLSYFDSLNPNIKEYTTSGAAPANLVSRGEVGIGVALLWNAVKLSNNNANLAVSIPTEGLPYSLFSMGMINGHQNKTSTKEVFSYLYNEMNKIQVEIYNPAKIYLNQGVSQLSNYPENIIELPMPTLYDPAYKATLLDKWKF